MTDREALLARIVALAEADARISALLLGGSLGRGDGDDWSDVDLIIVVPPAEHAGFVAGLRGWLEQAASVVHGFAPVPGAPLYSVVTDAWVRCDVTVTVPGAVLGGAQDRLRPLVDRTGVWPALSQRLPPREADARRVEALVLEFIRVLGLLPVAVGRKEWAVAVSGFGLQRTALINLMIEAQGLAQPPGALSLSRVLPEAELAVVDALPCPEPKREAVLTANRAVVEAFVPRARRLCEASGAAWPEAFWSATRRHLERTLGADWPPLA